MNRDNQTVDLSDVVGDCYVIERDTGPEADWLSRMPVGTQVYVKSDNSLRMVDGETPLHMLRNVSREALIAAVSYWSGWCTDNEETLPELTRLGGLLMDVKNRLRDDRPGAKL